MKQTGIQRQTFFVALIPIIVMTLLLGGYSIYARFAEVEKELMSRAELIAQQLASSSEYALFSGNRVLLEQLANKTKTQPDVNAVAIIDRHGKQVLLLGNTHNLHWGEVNAAQPVYQSKEMLLLYQPILPVQLDLDDLSEAEQQTAQSKQPVGAVIIEISRTRLLHEQGMTLIVNLVVMLFVFLLSSGMALAAARRITQPIVAMGASIQKIAEGELDVRVKAQSEVAELGVLITGINDMAQRLQLNQQQLERRIRQATHELRIKNHEVEFSNAEKTRLNKQLKEALENMQKMAHHDALTGIPNRALFTDRFTQALEIAKRDGTQLGLMFVDLDEFKPVNDQLGHHIGDLLLVAAAEKMQACVRASDTVARMGGDEFVVLLPNIDHANDVLLVAEKIRTALNLPLRLEGHPVHISASIGITLYPAHGLHAMQLMQQADIAMYYAKKAGRNRAVLFDPTLETGKFMLPPPTDAPPQA
jgi:diguanylate cyclase (GGDEF)-like protein